MDPCPGRDPDIFAAPFALIGVNYSFVFVRAHLPGLDPGFNERAHRRRCRAC